MTAMQYSKLMYADIIFSTNALTYMQYIYHNHVVVYYITRNVFLKTCKTIRGLFKKFCKCMASIDISV